MRPAIRLRRLTCDASWRIRFQLDAADPVVQREFSDVMQLVKPFELLDSPDIQRRIKASAEAVIVAG